MVVSGRLLKGGHNAVRAAQISSRHTVSHGPPIHIGDPSVIGIKDLYHPDIWSPGAIASQEADEIAMFWGCGITPQVVAIEFWGCGITPQVVAIESKVPFMITHWPGNMFITDWLSEELAILMTGPVLCPPQPHPLSSI